MQKINSDVTAIVLTHNRSSMIEGAIKSVFKQTSVPFETIVVDDGSTDGTEGLIRELQKHFSFVYLRILPEQSKGGDYARNLGIKSAHGKYLAFLDDDDQWLPEKIEKQMDYLQKHPGVSVVTCGKFFLDDSGKLWPEKNENIKEGDLHLLIFNGSPFVSSTLIISKKAICSIGMFDENLFFWQDYEMLIRLLQISFMGVVRENLIILRIFSSDKKRLSNKLYGFEKAVVYIEQKDVAIFKSLPSECQTRWRNNCLDELIRRADMCGEKKELKKLLKRKFLLSPTLKNFLKFIFGVGVLHKKKTH